jgi:hypothetical protein
MFGLLPRMLAIHGFNVQTDTLISTETLDKVSVLVIINPLEKLSKREKQAIYRFIDEGGSLLVMGDHTGAEQIRDPVNDLMKPFNLALNFDCAIPFRNGWNHSLRYHHHPLNNGIRSNWESNIFIGASLSISPPARPLVTGIFGFSDPGDLAEKDNGYLGDMKYLPGESLGDLILVAQTHCGKGKAILFGDTSPFQNGALVQSYPYVTGLFDHLCSQDHAISRYRLIIAALLLFSALIVGLTLINRSPWDLFFIFLAMICFSGTGLLLNSTSTEKLPLLIEQEKLALIDYNSLERFSLDQWKNDGYGGLCYNLMRNGFIPLLSRNTTPELLSQSRLLVVIAPAKPFSGSRLNMISHFVREGGTLLVTTGFEEGAGSASLLNAFGLGLKDVPLGLVDQGQNEHNITFPKAWEVNNLDGKAEILCQVWDLPVILNKPVGKGNIILVGDSQFLLNINLETVYDYNIHNILFFKYLMETQLSKP